MERIIDFKTTRNDNEKTVEAFLKEHGFTHQVLVNLKKTNNGITRNGIWAYTNEKISAGDKISVHIVSIIYQFLANFFKGKPFLR